MCRTHPSALRLLGVHLSDIKPGGKQHQSGTSVEKKTCTGMDGKSVAIALVLCLVSMAGSEGKKILS